ncbi:MAG: hypothetical protein QOJ75_1682, partial [Chloroflexota bacterium]|nr:hypothetical protein [Chloroflexota bacterium]
GPTQARRARDTDALAASTMRGPAAQVATAGASGTPLTPGFWDADAASAPATMDLPDPADELDAARHALAAGSIEEASLRFALALRLAPSLAPAVLEGTQGGTGPSLDMVRGDAFRLVGLETEALRAWSAAAWSGSRDRRRAPAREDPPAASDTIPPVQRSRTQGRHARH